MNTHDIEPLQDAADLLRLYLKLCKSLPRGDSCHHGRIERAIAAIEADRKRRGESNWIVGAVDAAMLEMKNIYPPFKRSECERLIRAAFSAPPAEPVTIPETEASDNPEPVACPICFEDEPHTGTCGSSDPKALCNQAEPVKVPSDIELDDLADDFHGYAGNTRYGHPIPKFNCIGYARAILTKYGHHAAPTIKESLTVAEPVVPEGFRLIAVNESFDSLMYWLDRCEQKGHLENCADLVEPWEAFEYREVEAPQPAEPVKEVSDAPAALRFAAQVVELYDDATMDNNYMIDSGDCAGILNALAAYFSRFNTTPPADGQAQQDAACVAPTSDKPASGAQNAIHATQPQQIPKGYKRVPIEPTEEMHAAAVRTLVRCQGNDDFPPRVYKAMLEAAPEPRGRT